MNRVVRRRLEMAERVLDFSRAHPAADAGAAEVLARLEECIERLESLAQEQEHGYLAARSAAVRRRGLRRRVQLVLLRHLVTVAAVAAREEPELTERFRLPAGNANNEAFRIRARGLLELGRARRELLTRHGLAERLLDDLAETLDQFDASVVETAGARREHVGARAGLDQTSDEVMRLVALLDGLNRYRFDEGSAARAEWEHARHVVAAPHAAGARKEVRPEAEGGEAEKPATWPSWPRRVA